MIDPSVLPRSGRTVLTTAAALVALAIVLAAASDVGPGTWARVVSAALYLGVGLLGLLLAQHVPHAPRAAQPQQASHPLLPSHPQQVSHPQRDPLRQQEPLRQRDTQDDRHERDAHDHTETPEHRDLPPRQSPRTSHNNVARVLLAASLGASLLPVTEMLAPHLHGAPTQAGLSLLDSFAAAAVIGLPTLGVLIFPDGHGHGRLGRVLVPVACAALVLLLLGGACLPVTPTSAPPFGAGAARVATPVLLGALALCVPLTVLAAATASARRRTARGPHRSGLRLLESAAWVNAGAFAVCATLSVVVDLPGWFGTLADQTGVVFAVAAWTGILRHRLVDLHSVLATTLPYVLVAACVATVSAVAASLAGVAAAGPLGAGTGAVVAALVALVLRDQLRTLANLIVYRRRLDPATEHSRRLEQALQSSHALLVTARDDERRRIRRDLHDGLGPTLAGLVLGVETVGRHLDDPARTRAELDRLHDIGRGAVTEVRRIVHALRPPVLDSLGLAGAIREQADRLGAGTVDITELPALPETLEIGVYFVALEAMKNASVHAGPGTFRVRLDATQRLRLEVRDDGPGLPVGYTPGVGIASMRERTTGLGGTLDIRPVRPRGTLLLAEWRLAR